MMYLYDFSQNHKSLCVCGDIHGEFKQLIYNIKRLSITDAILVVAGDCGIGFEKPEYYDQLYNRKEGVAGWLAKDSSLELDLDTERQAMDKLFDYLIRKNNPIAD